MTIVLQDDDERFGPKIIRNATVTWASSDTVHRPTFAELAPCIVAGQTPTRTDLNSRRNILASLTLLAVMGCQQTDTVVSTYAPPADPIPTIGPLSTSAGGDLSAAMNPVPVGVFEQVPIEAVTPRTPTVWTAQSLSLEVVPGSPPPQRVVAESTPVAEPVVADYKPPAVRPTPAAAAAAPTTTAVAPATPALAPAAVTVSSAAAGDIAARTNAVRTSSGLAPLSREASLDSGAVAWARELATSGVLRHSSMPQQLIGKPWSTVGENVGVGPTSAAVHDALVNSAGHLANIVGAGFTRLGVGAAVDAGGRLWVVEVFAG